eukprot:scaffold284636_cov13-Tisochrysis_lutea.AAC.1
MHYRQSGHQYLSCCEKWCTATHRPALVSMKLKTWLAREIHARECFAAAAAAAAAGKPKGSGETSGLPSEMTLTATPNYLSIYICIFTASTRKYAS